LKVAVLKSLLGVSGRTDRKHGLLQVDFVESFRLQLLLQSRHSGFAGSKARICHHEVLRHDVAMLASLLNEPATFFNMDERQIKDIEKLHPHMDLQPAQVQPSEGRF
jgi:hypothetical protein